MKRQARKPADARLYRVRSAGDFVSGWFDQYGPAVEFAALMIARAASSNTMERTKQVAIEWTDDGGKTIREEITVNITRSEAAE